MKEHGMFKKHGWTVQCAGLFGGAGTGRQCHLKNQACVVF